MDPSYYKSCIVPQCTSTSIKTPEKLFIYVPHNQQLRKKWLTLARRKDAHCLSSKSRMYFCEDHFDLPNDMLNYTEYHIMGKVSQVRMKPNCIPCKFACQEDRRKRTCNSTVRSYVLKKQRKTIIEECLKEQATQSFSHDNSPHTDSEFQTMGFEEPKNSCLLKVDESVPPEISCAAKEDKSVQSEEHHEASADKIRCPNCSTAIETKQYVQDRVNAILVNVYRYFATEGTELSPSQLRERTALCTGASEADVECALVLHQEVSATQKPLRKPPRKRRKKESKSPPPIQEEEPYIERETLIVTVDPKAGDANSEINPLAIKEEQPSSPITCEQDASLCEPQQSGLKPEDMAKVFVKTEPTEEPNTGPSQSSRPEQSSAVAPTPDIPPDTYFMIKNEEIDIEDNCGSDAESEEGYS